MERQIKTHKIEYLIKYTDLLKSEMMNKITDEKTLLYAVRNILVSSVPLEECEDYYLIDEYLSVQETLQRNYERPDLTLLQVLSGMVNIMNKGSDTSQIGQIISYYPLVSEYSSSHDQKRYSHSA